jgi:RHS repeat-associated protein
VQPLWPTATVRTLATFFGGKRIGTNDRLGSAKFNPNGQAQSFYPYGEDRGTVQPNDSLKFATYTRDSATGLDYADQRYYANNFGRFTSPDPYQANNGASGDTGDPGSWNRYSYTRGDPINRFDPMGLADFSITKIEQLQSLFMQWGLGGGGSVGFDPNSPLWRKGHPPKTQPIPYPRQFQTKERKQATDAFNNLGPGCKKALGKLWDLGSDPNGVLYKIGTDIFVNGGRTVAAGGVSDVNMSAFGFALNESVAEYLHDTGTHAFVVGNEVVLGPGFLDGNASLQAAELVHEVLHTYTMNTTIDDIGLATALGLADMITAVSKAQQEDQASGLVTDYLQADCSKKLMQ